MSTNPLEKKVLVLNKLWQAINICTVKRALCFLYIGHAKVVEANNGTYNTFDFSEWKAQSQNFNSRSEMIHTISYSLKIPQIVILTLYTGYPNLKVKLSRENIYKRDKYTCQYCGKKLDSNSLNIDHILPRRRGGKTAWTNVVCCCVECNLKKGDKTLQEVKMRLLKKPRPPVRYPLQNLHLSIEKHQSWSHFIDFSQWNVEIGDDTSSQNLKMENTHLPRQTGFTQKKG